MEPAYDSNPAMFRNHPLYFVLSVLLIAAFGLGILILLYWYLKTRSIRLTIAGDNMTLTRGLLSKEQTDLDIREIRTVHVRQTLAQRLFGVGTLEVFTGGDIAEFAIEGFPDPNFVRDYIRQRANGKGVGAT